MAWRSLSVAQEGRARGFSDSTSSRYSASN
jgi:hypothetical protein